MQETVQQYMQRTLGYVEGKEPLKVQAATLGKLKKFTRGLSKKQLSWQPEAGKWSIAEILAHLADVEVVASWRMRSVLGTNGITIQAFDQDNWASALRYAKQDPKWSLEVFRVLRENNLAMLKNLRPEQWENYGMHTERGKETISHLTRMFAGHDTNHLLQIERIVGQLRKKRKK